MPFQKAFLLANDPVSNCATTSHGSMTCSALSLLDQTVKEPRGTGEEERNISQKKHAGG